MCAPRQIAKSWACRRAPLEEGALTNAGWLSSREPANYYTPVPEALVVALTMIVLDREDRLPVNELREQNQDHPRGRVGP